MYSIVGVVKKLWIIDNCVNTVENVNAIAIIEGLSIVYDIVGGVRILNDNSFRRVLVIVRFGIIDQP